ncbi:hypothetical protein ACPF30_003698, partial [Vibrio cholerae]
KSSKINAQGSENSAFIVQAAQFGFWVLFDADLVESIESSVVSKSLKAKKRCSNAVGYSTRSVWFHKGLHHR